MAQMRIHTRRRSRKLSNVLSMFDPTVIREYKEAFTMIDQNGDGFIDKDDLRQMLTSLGKQTTDSDLDAMMKQATGPINFTMFLSMFGQKLEGTDPEDVIVNAFRCIDDRRRGFILEDELRSDLTTMGERWTDEMVDELFSDAPITDGKFNYTEFTKMLKHGNREKEDTEEEITATPGGGSA
ncbi:myosin regulatory light chain 2, smooth muscle minor isoform-like [Haliotis rubra]|uniref:myosin regulatory light chain 2, smooth muscle minor isoform-like n=1 Tax=Haliotis rubra TaxID=36100 RepID=UPI001EE55F72|nr:myosin regulatory light chain 2, smooth muscle minor isoform-like [Haliotis rubra]